MALYNLAERLNKTLDEVGQISFEEFNGWLAYYQIKAEQHGNDS